MGFVAPSRVGVVVYPRMPRQLIGPTEAFRTPWKLAAVWLFARMCSDVSCLMFQAVECLIAQRALVWARQVLSLIVGQSSYQGRQCPHRGSHATLLVCVSTSLTLILASVIVLLGLRVEQVGKIQG